MAQVIYTLGDLRWGYFWPYSDTDPNLRLNGESHDSYEPSLEDINREMNGRDTLVDMPVFAITNDQIIMLAGGIDPDTLLVEQIDKDWG